MNEIFGTWEKDRKEKVWDNILQQTLICGTAEAINRIYMVVTAKHTNPELLSLLWPILEDKLLIVPRV